MDYRADVIIVGGGIAGIVTALSLLDRHQRVLLLERQGPTGLGGLAQWALGGIFLVDTPLQRKVGVKDNAELAFSDWLGYAEFGPEDYWPKQWAEFYVHQAQAELYSWLTRRSVEFT